MGKLGGMCLNWKVLAGLGVVGLGVWAVAPNLIGIALPFLLMAVCPLSMVFMMRGMGGGACATQSAQADQPAQAESAPVAQLAALKEQQAAIAGEIARLEATSDVTPVERAAYPLTPERRVAVQ